jgi:hypothetical protein
MVIINHLCEVMCVVPRLSPKPSHSIYCIEIYFVTFYVLILLGYCTLIYHASLTSSWPDVWKMRRKNDNNNTDLKEELL